jgi:hypothetical protein
VKQLAKVPSGLAGEAVSTGDGRESFVIWDTVQSTVRGDQERAHAASFEIDRTSFEDDKLLKNKLFPRNFFLRNRQSQNMSELLIL